MKYSTIIEEIKRVAQKKFENETMTNDGNPDLAQKKEKKKKSRNPGFVDKEPTLDTIDQQR